MTLGSILWLNLGRVTNALKVKSDQDAWKVMIAYPKEHLSELSALSGVIWTT